MGTGICAPKREDAHAAARRIVGRAEQTYPSDDPRRAQLPDPADLDAVVGWVLAHAQAAQDVVDALLIVDYTEHRARRRRLALADAGRQVGMTSRQLVGPLRVQAAEGGNVRAAVTMALRRMREQVAGDPDLAAVRAGRHSRAGDVRAERQRAAVAALLERLNGERDKLGELATDLDDVLEEIGPGGVLSEVGRAYLGGICAALVGSADLGDLAAHGLDILRPADA